MNTTGSHLEHVGEDNKDDLRATNEYVVHIRHGTCRCTHHRRVLYHTVHVVLRIEVSVRDTVSVRLRAMVRERIRVTAIVRVRLIARMKMRMRA